jgi:hypothetical protein
MAAALTWEKRSDLQFRQLGQVEGDTSGWNSYLLALRDRSRSSMSGLAEAYRTLRGVRETLGLPFLATGEAAIDAKGALTTSEEKRILELGAVVDISGKAIDDAVAGKRRVAFSSDNLVSIEALSTDAARVAATGSDVFVVDAKTGQRVETTGTISGQLGIIPIGVALLVAAGVVVTVATVWLAVKAIETLKVAVEEKTTRTLSDNATKLVESGKATPQQAADMNTALLKGQAELAKAKTEQEKGTTPEVLSTVKTVAIVAAVIAGLYFAARVIPEIVPRRAAAA